MTEGHIIPGASETIKPPRVDAEGHVLGSSLPPDQFKKAAGVIAASVAGFEGTSVDPQTGAVRYTDISREEFNALSPEEQQAFINGRNRKQDTVLDALREKENTK